MIDLRYVKKLIEMIDESTVDSIEITSDKGMKIRISKSPQQRGAVQVAAPMPMPAMVARRSPPARCRRRRACRPSPSRGAPPAEPPKATALEVKSPMVGTYYKSPEPGAKPYVAVGDRVAKGQILCIIEAMKIMNEIESEYAGVVREILVAGRAAGRIRPGAVQDRSQWLIPRSAGSRAGRARADRAGAGHQLQGRPAGDDPAQRLGPAPEGRPAADAARRRRARCRSSTRRCDPRI